MAFPSVLTRETGTSGTSTTSHSIPAPTGTVAGNLVIVFWSNVAAAVAVAPSGYTQLAAHGLTGFIDYIWYKTASGSDTATFTSSASTTGRYVTLRISGASGVVSGDVATSASDTANSNPPSHTPAGGALDYLWIAARASADSGPSAAPSGFSNLTQTPAAAGSFATSEQTLNAASLDPGAFTSAAATWAAYTIAVTPGGGGGGGGPSIAVRTGMFF